MESKMNTKKGEGQPVSAIKRDLNIEISDDQAKHYFSNFVLTISNNEEIILGFGNRKVKNINEIDMINYFHLTIPHLKRLTSLLEKKVKEIEKEE
jgi:hypothetical protein